MVCMSLVRSDHLAVIVETQKFAKPIRKDVFFRATANTVRSKWKQSYPWNDIDCLNTASKRVSLLSTSLNAIFNECFPLIKVKMSSRDPPYMSPLVKYLCKIRNRTNKNKQNEEENVRIQKKINNLIGENQIKAVRDERMKVNTIKKEHRIGGIRLIGCLEEKLEMCW